ncbi:hypothetical protein RHSIM_Rhsim02G0105500 [Rhododendron simsii]|uniref:Protein FAR1-RELATED SEQUENCE n=1 Tax=Rhododendron simsii TaxID=118357 RepID=A0A834HIX5_RHOSS|nr:hypothetical protein RHSIM_Rhsim02G0105500 [Rhododendron simsii]
MQSVDDIQLPSASPTQLCEEFTNSSEALYTPEVKNEVIPKITQQFKSLEEVFKAYNNYAFEAGFSVRIHSSKTDKNGETIRKEYVCYKEGESEGFVVTQFVEEHSHPLTTPRKKHFLRSHRRVSLAQKALTQQLAAANASAGQQMSVLELQAGGLENVGCLRQDIYNSKRDMRNYVDGHDTNMLKELFETEKEKNPCFTCTIEEDDEHRQTMLFGCAFLSDETSESFEWLFKKFLKAMPGPPSKMIITDQDSAMTKAIASALPNTFYRYCICHIVSKFSEKIGALAYKEHYEEFKKYIWKSESPEEFDATWAYIVGKSNLSSHQWLQSMYEIRDRWVPAYTKHIFSAHMTSSQRAEISHAFFKRYMSDKNSMYEFVTRFDRALACLRHNELDSDHKDINEKPVLKASYLMEKKISELYTLHSFKKFQEEIFQIGAYVLTIKELPSTYILQRWTKTAKAGRVFDDLGSHQKEICGSSLLVRRQGLFQLAHIVFDDAVLDEKGTKIVREALLSSQKKIAFMRRSRPDGSTSYIQLPISLGSQHGLKEPLKVRAKGCGKRLKGGKEKAVKKSRKCHGCGLLGQSHDKRNCPKLMNMRPKWCWFSAKTKDSKIGVTTSIVTRTTSFHEMGCFPYDCSSAGGDSPPIMQQLAAL